MFRNGMWLVVLIAGAFFAGCGGGTTDTTAKALSTLTTIAQTTAMSAQSQSAFRELLAEGERLMPLSGSCTASDYVGSCSATASSLSSSVGCTTTGSSVPITKRCTFGSDFTACCGSTAFTVKSGSTSTFTISALTLSGTNISSTIRIQQNSTISGDGLSNATVVCDYSQQLTLRLGEMITALTSAGVATMTCQQVINWYRSNVSNYLTLTITATSGDACTINGTGVSASSLQTALTSASQACYRPS
jgi:hypothetical protein